MIAPIAAPYCIESGQLFEIYLLLKFIQTVKAPHIDLASA